MKKILRSLSLTLILALSIALIPTQKAYADTWIDAADPSSCTTNWESKKVYLPTLDVDCYVLYTSRESDEPSQDQMWRIPAGYPNVQDFNIPGTWWLHVYVPYTGQRVTFGPYQKDDVAPPQSTFQINTSIQVGQWNENVSSVSITATSRGDNGATGHDNINDCDSYWTAYFDYLEVWDGDTQLSVPAGQTYYNMTINTPGWHKIWARTWDKVGNYSDWTTLEFGIGSQTVTPPPTVEPGGDSSTLGKIKFDPNETKWTNKGKSSEGEGKYPVKVYYDGDNPYKTTGIATIEKEEEETDDEGNTRTVTKVSHETIEVKFYLESIDVSDAAEDTIDGDSGTIYIEQERYKLNLHGVGHWGAAQYDEPEDCVDVEYDVPDEPTGDSGNYNIDWTKPSVDFNMDGKQIFSEANGATRKASILGAGDSFYGSLTEKDNLSGAKSIDYKWTYDSTKPSSGYTNLYTSSTTNTNKSSEVIRRDIEKPVGDNLYLHVEVYDIAGNYTYERFGPFEDPIKLLNYEVTDIRDPRWQDVFWDDDNYKTYRNVSYKANQLPIDEASHPTMKNAYPKKGYAFYFDITSEYLYREADRIEIMPTFYYTNIFNQRIPLDLYYNIENNPLIKFGSLDDNVKLNLETTKYGDVWIGGISKLTLTKGVRLPKGKEWLGTDCWKDKIQYSDGKVQWWYGKYLIPATSVFVKQGDSPRPENIINTNNIIVNFQIVAYKNGVETLSLDQTFTYVPNQWTLEGGPKNSSYKPGDVMIYDNKYSALSDYAAHVIQ
jgi:hypothetical protein